MELKQLEVFSEITNYGIVRMPDRSFPGCVIQGDSLSILYNKARRSHCLAVQIGDSELVDETASLLEDLEDRLLHYEKVLYAHKIRLPYVKHADG